jgi:sugar lactone lactonase YvrE
MKGHPALHTFTALTLAAFLVSLPLRAAANPPQPGTITTVAGTGTPGYSGDNGSATQALLNDPSGLALDAAGNLYIADLYNHRVRKVSADGTISTVAGTGQPGFSGDGGKATDAQLNHPNYLVVDGAGNLLISDHHNHRVRKVAPDGIITTYAGSGPVEDPTNTGSTSKGGFSGDNGPATDARLNSPHQLAVDALGNLFIAEDNNRVRKVSPAGVITTAAGSGAARSSGDGGLATQAGVAPWGLAVDTGGDLFIAEVDDDRVRKVDAVTGTISTVAGTGQAGFSGDGGKATNALLSGPVALAVDSAGNLFISDFNNYRVRKVSPEGMITTVAGIGKKPYAGDGARATETGLKGPIGLAIDPLGNLFIADSDIFHESDGLPASDRVLTVFGEAAPGLLAGIPVPMPKQP